MARLTMMIRVSVYPLTSALHCLARQSLTPWGVWETDGQVAGYYMQYEKGFTFVTVHGAGHEVRWG